MKSLNTPIYGAAEQYYPEYGGGLWAMHLQRYKYVKNFCLAKNILDLGCGEGYGTAILKEVGKFTAGTDYDKEVLCRARKKYGHEINLVASDILQNCFKNNVFDVIVSFEVIEHMKNVDEYLYSVCKMLKQNGVFYLSTPNRSIMKKFRKKNKQAKFVFHHNELTLKELKRYLQEYFKEIKIMGQIKNVEQKLYNFIKMVDWFNLRHLIFPISIEKRLIKHFHKENTKDDRINDFIITNKIARQAPVFFAICKSPKIK